MSTLVALIRGVNVGGVKLEMSRLRTILTDCGFKDVRTYIQSGNAIFAATISPAKSAKAIAEKLTRAVGRPISVIVRTPRQLAAVIAESPFLKEKGIDERRLSVFFLDGKPSAQALKALAAVKSGRDRFSAREFEIYVHCPDGFGTSKLAATLERVIGVGATARNWNTVRKLSELATL